MSLQFSKDLLYKKILKYDEIGFQKKFYFLFALFKNKP